MSIKVRPYTEDVWYKKPDTCNSCGTDEEHLWIINCNLKLDGTGSVVASIILCTQCLQELRDTTLDPLTLLVKYKIDTK